MKSIKCLKLNLDIFFTTINGGAVCIELIPIPIIALIADLLKTTGLVGLAVCKTPHEALKMCIQRFLMFLDRYLKNAAYRKYIEQITNEKLSMVKAEPDVKKLGEQLQGGQVEEVIDSSS